MGSSSAPRERMFSCTSPQSRRTATARSTKERPWSLICSRAPKAFRRQTSCAPNCEKQTIREPSRSQREGFLCEKVRSKKSEVEVRKARNKPPPLPLLHFDLCILTSAFSLYLTSSDTRSPSAAPPGL